jgi:hypothetical protein
MPVADAAAQAQMELDLAEIDTAIQKKEADPVLQTASGDIQAVEKEAGRHGWVPKDLYKGDPAKWKPASQYLEEGLRYNRNVKRELEDLKTRYAGLEKTGQAFAKFHEEAMARKDTELKDAITAAKRQVREATRNGDDDLVDQLEDRVTLLQEERATLAKQEPVVPKAAEVQQEDPVLTEWVEDGNDWFREDEKLRSYAIAMGQEMRKAGNNVVGRKFLDAVSGRMAEEFPRRFAKKTPSVRQNQVETSDAGGDSSSGYSIHDLPAEDLALMKDFISKGWTTKDKFLKNYFQPGKKSHRSA